KVYTVNRSEVRSDPVNVTIQPLISPIELAFGTLKTGQDFGGVNIQFDNEEGIEFVLYVLTKDEEDAWQIYDRLYTTEKQPNYTSRGLEAEKQEFAFYFQDKWNANSCFSASNPLDV